MSEHKIPELVFHEINRTLLSACKDGHRADVWTRPDYDFINIYLSGFEMGQGKVAVLKKSDNHKLAKLVASNVVLNVIVKKQNVTSCTLEFVTRTEKEITSEIERARELSKDSNFQLELAERDLKSLRAKKLLSKYKPSTLSFYCALRTPSPIRFSIGEELVMAERTAGWYAANSVAYVIFSSPQSLKTGYVRATADVRNRIVKSYFNGYQVSAKVTGLVQDIQKNGLASIWDECECSVEVTLKVGALN